MFEDASPDKAQPQALPDAMTAPITVDWDLGFARTPTKKAWTYWASLCAGRKMPGRRELNPQPMRAFLRHVNLVDVVGGEGGAAADYIVSLQGEHAHEVFGPVARRNLDHVLPEEIGRRWRTCFDLGRNAACPVRFSSRLAAGKTWLASETLLAPLGEGAQVESFFLVFVSWPVSEDAGREPRFAL